MTGTIGTAIVPIWITISCSVQSPLSSSVLLVQLLNCRIGVVVGTAAAVGAVIGIGNIAAAGVAVASAGTACDNVATGTAVAVGCAVAIDISGDNTVVVVGDVVCDVVGVVVGAADVTNIAGTDANTAAVVGCVVVVDTVVTGADAVVVVDVVGNVVVDAIAVDVVGAAGTAAFAGTNADVVLRCVCVDVAHVSTGRFDLLFVAAVLALVLAVDDVA